MNKKYLATGLVAVVIIFLLIFYRSPTIFTIENQCKLLKPCGGVLDHINVDKDYIHLYWFLNLLDIHTQYAPVCGVIHSVEEVDGQFFPAYDLDASHQNKRIITKIKDKRNGIVILEQVAGILTRGIENNVKAGQPILAGEKIGHIYFGSRVVLRLPKKNYNIAEIQEKVGQSRKPGEIL